jgi:hypothetical protein
MRPEADIAPAPINVNRRETPLLVPSPFVSQPKRQLDRGALLILINTLRANH